MSPSLKGLSTKDSLPDLKQNDEFSCAPVSATNAIIGIEKNCTSNARKLANLLAINFKTDENGTTSQNLCTGLEKYFKEKGQTIKIDYQGYRDVDKKYKTAGLPDMTKIKKAVEEGKAVLLNLGIYKKSDGIYTRQYGHFVNVVGCGSNGIVPDKNYLTITDPYNKISGRHYIKYNEIKEGKFVHNKDDNEVALTDDAKGFNEITQKFNYFNHNESAVINGAVIFSSIPKS